MMHILEYILENYTWFLVGIVLILLAIIGYYADKTNFGHGKKNTQKENDILQDNDKTINIENIGLLDATEEEKKEVPVNEDIKNDNSGDVNNLVSQNVESIYNDPSNKTLENGVKNYLTNKCYLDALYPSFANNNYEDINITNRSYELTKFPHPIFNNCLPHIDVFLDNGYTKEEEKNKKKLAKQRLTRFALVLAQIRRF